MRFWLSGPRFLGIRPGISISSNDLKPKQSMYIRKNDMPVRSYIYVIKGDHNMVKVGITTNPAARIAQLRTGSAFPIRFELIGIASGNAMDIEREAHALLSAHVVNGEWFDVSPELAMSAVMGAAAKLGQSMHLTSLDSIQHRVDNIPAVAPLVLRRPPFGLFNCLGMIVAIIIYYFLLIIIVIAYSGEHGSFTTWTYLTLMLIAWIGGYYTARPKRIK